MGAHSASRLPTIDAAAPDQPALMEAVPEEAWIEVIQKMEHVYSDLVNSQSEIEEKNAALVDAQQFIRSVLRALPDVLIVCDLKGQIEQTNQALHDLTGEAKGALSGVNVVELFTPESRDEVSRLIQSAPLRVSELEVALTGVHGESHLLAINCSGRFDSDGRLVGRVLIGRPIGELRRAYEDLNNAHRSLKRAQAQLVQSEKMASLGRLVAGVAHELNNPISFVFGNMTALKGYGERIRRYLDAVDRLADDEELRQLRCELKIDRILDDLAPLIDGSLEGAERVRDIVQSLRRYSTPQQDATSHFDLPDAIRTAVSWVSRGCRRPFNVDYDLPEVLEIRSSKGTVHQILMNLVQNEVDVMEDCEEPSLSITCRD
ncbi:MAG: PAS domain-containing protein, partial [Pseudomonadota bacterium]